jgi:hypothetical protein
MSSPELLRVQSERSLRELDDKTVSAEPEIIEAELAKLHAEEDRYAQAYGAGLFSLDQFKAYATPLRARSSNLEKELVKTRSAGSSSSTVRVPRADEIEKFAFNVAHELLDLNFDEKRAIVSRVITKVVGTQKSLIVIGCLPIPEHVEHKSNDRDGAHGTRHRVNDDFPTLRFEFTIKLPAPNYQTVKRCRKTQVAARTGSLQFM